MMLTTLSHLLLAALFTNPAVTSHNVDAADTSVIEVRTLEDFSAIQAADGIQVRVQRIAGPTGVMVEGPADTVRCVEMTVDAGVLSVSVAARCQDRLDGVTVWVNSADELGLTRLDPVIQLACANGAAILCREA